MKKLSIVIVNYNAKEFIQYCIQSCLDAYQIFDMEIIIVDNNSKDGSEELISNLYSQVKWIQNNINLGFSKANNIGVKQAFGDYILFLNPDTIIPENIFLKIFDFIKDKKNLGALGVRMVDENSIFRPESKRNIPNPKNTFAKLFSYISFFNIKKENNGYYNNTIGEFENGEVEILTGAFFFTPKKVFEAAGGFDETYFMYGEDIDLSYTILNLGYQNYYLGESTIIHFKGKSTVKNKIYYQRFFTAIKIFIKKYHRKPFYIYISLLTGLKIRYYLTLLFYKLKK